MIHYALQCSHTHEFDGWFASSDAFDAQVSRGLVECPHCGDLAVSRALMAPAVPRKGKVVSTPSISSQPMVVADEKLPAYLRAAMQTLRAEVERNCEYVGDQFAEEARRIHDGDSEMRGIYGQATAEQADALADDGIEIARIPWLPRADG